MNVLNVCIELESVNIIPIYVLSQNVSCKKYLDMNTK